MNILNENSFLKYFFLHKSNGSNCLLIIIKFQVKSRNPEFSLLLCFV